jgi:hypothetical protein
MVQNASFACHEPVKARDFVSLGRDVRRQHDAQGGQLVALPRVGRVQETLVVAAGADHMSPASASAFVPSYSKQQPIQNTLSLFPEEARMDKTALEPAQNNMKKQVIIYIGFTRKNRYRRFG